MLVRFLENCRGGVAPLMGILALPLMGSVGVAVDYSRANAARAAMQGALDSTVLFLVKQAASGADVSGQAQQIFGALFARPEVLNVSVNVNSSGGSASANVSLTASGAVMTTFLGVLGYSTLNITTQSNAYSSNDSSGCVLALDSTAAGAASASGSSTVSLKDCSLYSNSNSESSLTAGGSTTVSASIIGVVGGVSLSGSNVTTTEGIRTGVPQISDPYIDVTFPSYSGCTQNNLTAKTTITISPGVYCNGISVNANAVLTLNPGIYYIDRGSFDVNGGGKVTGTGVTLVFTSSTGTNWPTATINGNAVVSLTPPLSGPTTGIVIFGDRRLPIGTAFKLNGGSDQSLSGAIYVPTGAINYSGGTSSSMSCTQIIGDTVSFTGNSNVAINCSSYKTRPFGLVLVRLTS